MFWEVGLDKVGDLLPLFPIRIYVDDFIPDLYLQMVNNEIKAKNLLIYSDT